jgi:hypothetical protein
MWKPSLSLVVLALAMAPAFWAQSNTPASALPAGPMQAKATTACLECHDAHIIEQQRLSKATWTKEVDKMVKWGAVVDPKDRDALIDYLSENFGTDKPPYVATRSAAAKVKK